MDGEQSYYCKSCNKDVGSKWVQTCPHCKAFATVAAGKPLKLGSDWVGTGGKPVRVDEVEEVDHERLLTGTREVDRVLGGGLVTGSTVLISGDPGIGKSTLLLQVGLDMASAIIIDEETDETTDPLTVLYVSAEETNSQIRGRAVRLDPEIANPVKQRAQGVAKEGKRFFLYNECDVEEIERYIAELRPDVLVIDSIQTMVKRGVDGSAGSVTQVRECAIYLVGICKARGIGCFLVAHITKDGVVAGPKTLEHLVDCTLEFHKEGMGELRSIRPNKNRFGDTNEVALLRMTGVGLQSIENPNELLLEHHKDGKAGVCIGLAATGPRPFAMEVQTLLGPVQVGSAIERSFKRVVTGMSSQRATQVIAILERRIGLDLRREVFINVPGGLDEVKDPSIDLSLALALTSHVLDIALPESFIAFGEIGLAGEIRPVMYNKARIKTAALMGFKMIVGPVIPSYEKDILEDLGKTEIPGGDGKESASDRYYGVATLEDAFDLLEGFIITPHEPKQSKVKEGKRKKGSLYVVKDPDKDPDDRDER
jgi:DNA repair protein RadA/Sms